MKIYKDKYVDLTYIISAYFEKLVHCTLDETLTAIFLHNHKCLFVFIFFVEKQ